VNARWRLIEDFYADVFEATLLPIVSLKRDGPSADTTFCPVETVCRRFVRERVLKTVVS
jgi:hypothetical protein